jgi:hypothetical protein
MGPLRHAVAAGRCLREASGMTNATLARLLPSLLKEIEGSNGFWHGQREDVAVYIVADEDHDRMRVMSPVGELKRTDAEFLSLLLQAIFDRALDAKYALRRKELWSVFMHPLSTLVPDDLGLYLDQVVRLVKNTGSTYASSDLVFGIGDDDNLDVEFVGEDEEVADEDEDEDDDDVVDEEAGGTPKRGTKSRGRTQNDPDSGGNGHDTESDEFDEDAFDDEDDDDDFSDDDEDDDEEEGGREGRRFPS